MSGTHILAHSLAMDALTARGVARVASNMHGNKFLEPIGQMACRCTSRDAGRVAVTLFVSQVMSALQRPPARIGIGALHRDVGCHANRVSILSFHQHQRLWRAVLVLSEGR